MPRALLSVSDKTGVAILGNGLAIRGFELVSTGGTARALLDAGLEVVGVSDLTGFPELMDGRVKTLHPKIHGGILARRDRADDLAAIDEQQIGLIDIVVVNLYPFRETAGRPGVEFEELIEQIDIGGPSLVRAAAKNFRDVLVVVDPDDYPRLLTALDEGPSLALRFELMRKAIAHTAAYDAAISGTLASVQIENGRFSVRSALKAAGENRRALGFETHLDVELDKIRDLRYGENPHQKAAWYRTLSEGAGSPAGPDAGFGLGAAEILQGKELSYTNLLDLDTAARIAMEFTEPAAVVVKHTNPCGVATGSSAADAYVRARDADNLAAFGGIVALNRTVDVAAAEAIVSTFIEALIAPGVDAPARGVLARKANMRVVTADMRALDSDGWELRSILGAVLVQQRDHVEEALQQWPAGERAFDGAGLPRDLPGAALKVVTRRQPTPEEWEALRFAWRVCAHVKSNAVVFTDAARTRAIGAGQMSRVDAVHVAVAKAAASNISLTGTVAASDAFFPFRDGLDAIAKAGATAIVQPGGSVRDSEVIAAADEHGIAMVFTGRRHFRH
jgi:phosphoribosylaminoimidazolecarboxamide formyltransferase/IMP cyclohydrolase